MVLCFQGESIYITLTIHVHVPNAGLGERSRPQTSTSMQYYNVTYMTRIQCYSVMYPFS